MAKPMYTHEDIVQSVEEFNRLNPTLEMKFFQADGRVMRGGGQIIISKGSRWLFRSTIEKYDILQQFIEAFISGLSIHE